MVAGGVAQWLRALGAQKDLDQAPRTHMSIICNSSFMGSDALFWSLWVPGMNVVRIEMQYPYPCRSWGSPATSGRWRDAGGQSSGRSFRKRCPCQSRAARGWPRAGVWKPWLWRWPGRQPAHFAQQPLPRHPPHAGTRLPPLASFGKLSRDYLFLVSSWM